MNYRCEAVTIEGFVQQLAVQYVSRGYFFYVTGEIPAGKDPKRVDEKLIGKYEITDSKWSRARRKRSGTANIHYLRYQRWFVLLATHGQHRFFEEEGASYRDVRETPIKFGGYSIGHKKSARVHIEREVYLEIRAWFLENALHRSAKALSDQFRALGFEPYGGVKKQLFSIHSEVNLRRGQAGFEPVEFPAGFLKRTQRKPFVGVTELSSPPISCGDLASLRSNLETEEGSVTV